MMHYKLYIVYIVYYLFEWSNNKNSNKTKQLTKYFTVIMDNSHNTQYLYVYNINIVSIYICITVKYLCFVLFCLSLVVWSLKHPKIVKKSMKKYEKSWIEWKKCEIWIWIEWGLNIIG